MPRWTQYFGVAGVMNAAEAADARLYPGNGPPTAIGVLAGLHTLEGNPPHNPHRYPAREVWNDIFAAVPKGHLGFLHYSGPNDETLPAQLDGVLRWAGERCSGIQLNIAWPVPAAVHGLRISHPKTRIILQVSAKALRIMGDRPALVAEMIRKYGPDIDYILVDPSGGTGRALTEELAVPLLETFRQEFGHAFGLGIAGGFGPYTTDLAGRLMGMYLGLSVDAEAKLRDGSDRLDISRAARFLSNLHAHYLGIQT